MFEFKPRADYYWLAIGHYSHNSSLKCPHPGCSLGLLHDDGWWVLFLYFEPPGPFCKTLSGEVGILIKDYYY